MSSVMFESMMTSDIYLAGSIIFILSAYFKIVKERLQTKQVPSLDLGEQIFETVIANEMPKRVP